MLPIAVSGPEDLSSLGERLDWLRQRLLALEQEIWDDPVALKETKTLMRRMLNVRLEGRPLQSRRVLRQIREIEV